MKINELLNKIDSFAPWALAEEWDNPGLMVGNYNAEVTSVAFCLDPVPEAVIEASEKSCEVLLTHHPLIFRAIKKINLDSQTGKTIAEAITRKINIIAAHTNWDKAEEGVNATLAKLIGLEHVELLGDFPLLGTLKEKLSLEKFSELVKNSWGLSRLDLYAEKVPEKISRVALCGGSGAEFWSVARLHKADIYLTADMKYHELIDATRAGLVVALADHGEMERASLPELAKKISALGLQTELLNINALNERLKISL